MAPVKTRSSQRIKNKTVAASDCTVSPLQVPSERNSLPQSAGKGASQDIVIKRFPSLIIKKKNCAIPPKITNSGNILLRSNSGLNGNSSTKVAKSQSLKATDLKTFAKNEIVKGESSVTMAKNLSSFEILPQTENRLNEGSLTLTLIKSPTSKKTADDIEACISNKNKQTENGPTTSKSIQILPHSNGQKNGNPITMTIIKLPPPMKADANVPIPDKKESSITMSKTSTLVMNLPQDRLKRGSVAMTMIKLPSSSRTAVANELSSNMISRKTICETPLKSVNSIENLSQSNGKFNGGLVMTEIKSNSETLTSDKNVTENDSGLKSIKPVDMLPQSNGLLNGSVITINPFPSLKAFDVKAPDKNVENIVITSEDEKNNSVGAPKLKGNNQHSKTSKTPVLKTYGKYIPMNLQKVEKPAKTSDTKFNAPDSGKKQIKFYKIPLTELSKLLQLKTVTMDSSKSKLLSPVSKTDDSSSNLDKEMAKNVCSKSNQSTNKRERTSPRLLMLQNASSSSLPSPVSESVGNSGKKSTDQIFLKPKQKISKQKRFSVRLPTSQGISSLSLTSNDSSSVCKKITEEKSLLKAKQPIGQVEHSLLGLLTSSSSCESVSQNDSSFILPNTDADLSQLLGTNNPAVNCLQKSISNILPSDTELSVTQLISQEATLDLLKNSILRERKNEVNSIINPPIDDSAISSADSETTITLSSDESSVEDDIPQEKKETEATNKINRKRSLAPKEKLPKALKLNDENSLPASCCVAELSDSETSVDTANHHSKKKQINLCSVRSKKKCETLPGVTSIAEMNGPKEEKKKLEVHNEILDVDSSDPGFEKVNINHFFQSGEFEIPHLGMLMKIL